MAQPNYRLQAALDYRETLGVPEVTVQKRKHSRLWAWLAVAFVMPGSWGVLYIVAEFLMHLFGIPHPHFR